MNIKNTSQKGFTLIEMVVVVAIVSILGAVGFTTIVGYFEGSRDGTRVEDMHNIYAQLDIVRASAGEYPMPDNARPIALSSSIITYQGYTGKAVLDAIKFEKGGRDPTDETYYTYTINKKQSQAQLMAYFEEYDVTKLSNAAGMVVPEAYAATIDYTDRKIGVLGKILGILIDTTTLAPVQDAGTGTLDIASASGYTVYFSNTASSSGSNIAADFVSNSAVYENITSTNGICGASHGNYGASAPSVDLCTTGTPSVVTGSGPWTWNCTGVGTGTGTSCSASTYAGVFATGSEYTSNWATNTCNPAAISVVTVTAGTGTIPLSLAANTVYKLSSGDFFSTGSINMSSCSAVIGEGTGSTKVWYIGASTGSLIKSAASNFIVSKMALGQKSSVAMDYGFQTTAVVQNGAFTDLAFSGGTNGLAINNGGGGHYMHNISVYGLVGFGKGVRAYQTYNAKISNIDIGYSNGGELFSIYGPSTGGEIRNVRIHDNPNILQFGANFWVNGAVADNIITYNNSGSNINGMVITGSGNIFSNLQAISNNGWGITISNATNCKFTNILTAKNLNNGIHLSSSSNNDNIFDRLISFENGDAGFRIGGGTRNVINRFLIFNNKNYENILIWGGGIKIEKQVFENGVIFNASAGARLMASLSGTLEIGFHNVGFYSNAGNGGMMLDNWASQPISILTNEVYIAGNNNSFYKNGGPVIAPSRYYGNLKVFGNTANSFPPELISGSGTTYPFFLAGAYSTGGTFDASWTIQPSNVLGWNPLTTGRQTGLTWPDIPTFTYGSNIPNQKRPVRFNSTTGILEEYGTDGVDYDSTKKIGQW